MASRYWVGGTAAWDGTAGSKWALTSGGAGGQAVPTSADDVFLDGNSGAVTVTVQTAVAVGGSVNCTGFTGTLVQTTNMNIGSATAGDFILGSGMTFTWSAGAIKLTTTKVAATSINLAGKTVGNFTINGNGASFVLANDIIASVACAFSGGSVDFNGFNVTCGNLSNGNTLTRSVNMRGGSITITGTGAIFDAPAGTLTFTWTAGAKFVLSNVSASAKTFAGGTNTTYPLIQVAGGASAGTVTFSGAFTCAGFIWDADSNVVYTVSTTYTATSLLSNGTSGHNASIKSTAAGTPFTLAVSAQPTVSFCTVKDCTASGGTPFIALNSTSVSGNTNWSFASIVIITKGLIYNVARQTTPTKALKYTVRANAPPQTKSLKYTIRLSHSAITKSLKYSVARQTALTKSLKYTIAAFASAVTKSLKYTVPHKVTKTLSLVYEIVGIYKLTKSTRYAVRTTPADSRAWTPADTTLPDWWIDASQLAGLVDGDPVTSWDDESGNLAPAVVGTFSAPHYKTNILNGKPVVRFVAASNEALRALPNTGAGAMTMFAVGKLNGGADGRLIGGIYPLKRNWLIGWWNGTEDSLYAEGFVNSGGTATTAVKVYSAVLTGSLTSFYNEGNLIASNTGGLANINSGVALSGYDATGSSELSNGDIAEVLIYNSALNTADRQKVEGYLAWKYGTQAQLDVSHPYYSAAPTYGVVGLPKVHKSLAYAVSFRTTATKQLKYEIRINHALTKALKYTIRRTPSAITKALRYEIRGHTALTKSAKYTIRGAHSISKALKYTIAKNIALTKSLRYEIRGRTSFTKALKYTLRTTPAAKTKSLKYTIAKQTALTKSLRYVIFHVTALTKSLKYIIVRTNSKTLSLAYVVHGHTAITKSLKYVVAHQYVLTKTMTYTVLKDPYHKVHGLYSPTPSPYHKQNLYTPAPKRFTKAGGYTPF